MLPRTSLPLALKEWGGAINRRSGFWKARVALAPKLAVSLHRLWIEERSFEVKVIGPICQRPLALLNDQTCGCGGKCRISRSRPIVISRRC